MTARFPLTLAILLASLLASAALTLTPSQASPTGGYLTLQLVADGNERFSVKGVVQSVSYASNTVALEAGGQTIDILVTPTTVISYRGESGSIADIRKGSKVSASGIVRSGQKIALSIVVK